MAAVSLSAPNLEVLLRKFPSLLNDAERQFPEEKRTLILRSRVTALLKDQTRQGQQQQQRVQQPQLQPPAQLSQGGLPLQPGQGGQNVAPTPRPQTMPSPQIGMQQSVAPQQGQQVMNAQMNGVGQGQDQV